MRLSDGALKSLARWQSAGNQLIRSCIQCAFAHYSGRCSSRVRRSNELLRERKNGRITTSWQCSFLSSSRGCILQETPSGEKNMEFCKKRETARENRETYFDSVKSKFKEKKKRNNRVSIACRKEKRAKTFVRKRA